MKSFCTAVLLLLLSACGQAGPLVLPDDATTATGAQNKDSELKK